MEGNVLVVSPKMKDTLALLLANRPEGTEWLEVNREPRYLVKFEGPNRAARRAAKG